MQPLVVRFGVSQSLALALLGFPSVASAQACADAFRRTYEVQGSGDESPLLGETVVVGGVVTADFRGEPGDPNALDGLFVQDREGDGDPKSSDGLFLYFGPDHPVARLPFLPGTSLRASGVVTEYDGETQLRVEDVVVCGVEAPVPPTQLGLPASSARQTEHGWVAELEAREGMLLSSAGPLYVADLGAYARYGELTLVHGAVPWAFTHDNEPSTDAFPNYERAVAQRTLVLDDGSNTQYPDREPHPAGLRIGAAWEVPSAYVLRPPRFDARGSGAAYRMVALDPVTWALPLAGPAAPTPTDHSITRLVSVNLHNLFKDGGDGAACYPSFDAEDCRGDTDAAARMAHRRDSARHAATWGADIIAANEVQNDFGGSAEPTWVMWVRDLNAASADIEGRCRAYAPVTPADYHGGDAIAVALAYCADTLRLDDFAAPRPEIVSAWGPGVFSGPNSSRLPLLGTFTRLTDGRTLSVAVNHLKSRSPGALPQQCPNARLPDCDTGDGQGYFGNARIRAAEAVSEWLRDPSLVRGQSLLVVGDLNSYAREQPLLIFQQNGYVLLTDPTSVTQPSYAYDARLGVLDHLLISRAHLASVANVGVIAGNVGSAPANGAFSDHDPVFVDLVINPVAACDCSTATLLGTHGDDVLWGTEQSDVICTFGGDDVVFGVGEGDCVDGGLGEDWVFTYESSALARTAAEHVLAETVETGPCNPRGANAPRSRK